MKVHVTKCRKCHTCHANCRSMSLSATPAMQGVTQPSVVSATPATRTAGPCHQVPPLPRNLNVRQLGSSWARLRRLSAQVTCTKSRSDPKNKNTAVPQGSFSEGKRNSALRHHEAGKGSEPAMSSDSSHSSRCTDLDTLLVTFWRYCQLKIFSSSTTLFGKEDFFR